jgi:hypothetical protein
MIRPHNTERQAAMERNRGMQAAARSAANPMTARPNNRKTTAVAPEREARTVTKRKRGNDMDHMPRKKVSVKDAQDVARIRARYQEPKGLRKSKRVAGQVADPTGPEPQGQYVRSEDNSDTSSVSSLQTTRRESSATPEPPADSSEDTEEERTIRRAPSNDQNAHTAQERSRSFLRTLVENLNSHKIVRRLANIRKGFFKHGSELQNAPGGLADLEKQIRDMEQDPEASDEDLRVTRDKRAKWKQALKENDDHLRALSEMKDDLGLKHRKRTDRIYDFIEVPRGEVVLQCLPAEFWTAFDRCCEAYTARKDVELDIDEAAEEQRKTFYAFDEQVADVVCQKALAPAPPGETIPPQLAAFSESIEVAEARISALGGHSLELEQLEKSMVDASDAQYREEARLHETAEAAFVTAGFLTADVDDDNRELHYDASSWGDDDSQSQGQRQGTRAVVAASDGDASLVARVKHARIQVEDCRRRLRESRWSNLSDVGSSMDADAQGEARFLRMNRLTRQLRSAENRYWSVLHRAQDEHAIRSESDQASNFRDHESDGYQASTIRNMGCPMPEKKSSGVEKWISGIGKSVEKPPTPPTPQDYVDNGEKEGEWVDRVPSLMLGAAKQERKADPRAASTRGGVIAMNSEGQGRLRTTPTKTRPTPARQALRPA